MPCMKRGMATVGQVIVKGKLGCSRPQGETHRIVSWLAGDLRHGYRHAHLSRTCGEDRINSGVRREIHFKCTLTCLCLWRAGFVCNLNQVGNVKQLPVGSGSKDFDRAGYAPHSARCVEDLDGKSVPSGSLLIIADALVKHAHQVWFARILHIEGKRSMCVGLGACLLLHLPIQTDKENIGSNGGFATGLIPDGTLDNVRVLRGGLKTRNQSEDRKKSQQ